MPDGLWFSLRDSYQSVVLQLFASTHSVLSSPGISLALSKNGQHLVRTGDIYMLSRISTLRIVSIVSIMAVGFPCRTIASMATSAWKATGCAPSTRQSEVRKIVWMSESAPSRYSSATNDHQLIQDIEFQVFIANWDTDAATDGLIVRVSSFDVAGVIAELKGRLDVLLLVRRRLSDADGANTDGKSNGKPNHISSFGQWSRHIKRIDRRLLTYEFRLPFEQDMIEPQCENQKIFVALRLYVAGRTYRALQQPLRIDLSKRIGRVALQPVNPAASLPAYVIRTPCPLR